MLIRNDAELVNFKRSLTVKEERFLKLNNDESRKEERKEEIEELDQITLFLYEKLPQIREAMANRQQSLDLVAKVETML